MTTRIRLRRMGSNKRPFFRVVVADQRSPRDGRFIENIGKYHPLDDPSVIEIDQPRPTGCGSAQPDQVRNLMQKVGIWDEFVKERPSAAAAPAKERVEKPKLSKKAKERRRRPARPRRGAGGRGGAAAEEARRRRGRGAEAAEATAEEAVEAVEPPAEGAAGRNGRGNEGRDGRGTRSGRRRVKDLVEFLVQELVDEPDAVSIEESFDDRGPRYRVRVAPEDMGKVIGRGGRTAKAIRTVVRAAAQRQGHGAMVDIED